MFRATRVAAAVGAVYNTRVTETHAIDGHLELPLPEIVPPVYRSRPNLEDGKHIVICADGTGNADIKGRGSNVFKIFEAIDTTSHLYAMELPRQIAFYDEGVGTESWWPRRVLGGAAGVGLGANVRQLYTELARVYRPGDRVYLFGFSRGAFTVRTLAALIDCCGIIDGATYLTRRDLTRAVAACYRQFKRQASRPDEPLPADIRRHQTCPIEFVGVWDTVDAVGLPLKVTEWINRALFRFKLDVRHLPAAVRHGCHALALDDPREAFTPLLWTSSDRIEQVWFAGAHSDVGGGYPRHGLSLIPLHWMMERARARGLRFVASDRQYFDEHQIVADKLHDPRSGLALYYRWKPRDVAALCADAGVAPHLHITVFDRIAQGVDGYAPINIPSGPVVTFTQRRDWKYVDPTAVLSVLATHTDRMTGAAAQAAPVLGVGVKSYWLFVIASLLLVYGAARLAVAGSLREGLSAAAGLILAYLLAGWTDGKLDRIFSKMWQEMRSDLRAGLARRAVPPTATAALAAGPAVSLPGVSSPPA